MVRVKRTGVQPPCLHERDRCSQLSKEIFKAKRIQVIKQCIKKLKKIEDVETCLREALLIKNTYHAAKLLTLNSISG